MAVERGDRKGGEAQHRGHQKSRNKDMDGEIFNTVSGALRCQIHPTSHSFKKLG